MNNIKVERAVRAALEAAAMECDAQAVARFACSSCGDSIRAIASRHPDGDWAPQTMADMPRLDDDNRHHGVLYRGFCLVATQHESWPLSKIQAIYSAGPWARWGAAMLAGETLEMPEGDGLEVVSTPDLSAILLSDYTSAMAAAAEARQTIAKLQARLRPADALADAVSALLDVGEGGFSLVEWENAFDAVQAAHAAYLHGPQTNEGDDE